MEAFRYPPEPHIRRHGPRGYLRTESFRPWLRDEFSFRCIYCLLREQWGRSKGVFGVDHFLAVACFPDEELEYDNLLYCCTTCNAAKGKRRLPRPEDVLVAGDIHIDEDGSMTGRSFQARQLIRVLGLDDTEYREFRVLWSEIIDLAKTHDAQVYRKLVGYPAKLPNLAVLRPPQGNTRPEGVKLSCFSLRREGTLPEVY